MKPAEQSSVVGAKLFGDFPGARSARGRAELSAGPGRNGRRGARRAPRYGRDRLHRLAGGGTGDQRPRGRDLGPGTPSDRQARDRRNGGQERDHRRRRRRSGRGGPGRGEKRLRLPGPEVLGLLARDRARNGLRPVPVATCRRDAQPQGRPRRRAWHCSRAGDRCRGLRADQEVHRDRPQRRARGAGRRHWRTGETRLLHRAAHFCRCRPKCPYRAGRDFRSRCWP